MRLVATLCVAAALVRVHEPPPPDPRVERFAELPDWSGIWIADGLEPGIDGFSMSRLPGFLVTSPASPWNETTVARLRAELATNPELQIEPAAGGAIRS